MFTVDPLIKKNQHPRKHYKLISYELKEKFVWDCVKI